MAHTPEEIVAIVDKMEMDRAGLHEIMDSDMSLYHLEQFVPEVDATGQDILEGYVKFTANDPATVMDLALHLGSTAKRIIKVETARAQQDERELNNVKELFALGILASADERRAKLMMPELQDSMFSQSLFRGRIAQRVLLVREDTGDFEPVLNEVGLPELDESGQPMLRPVINTYVDIADWDPRNVYWRMGRHGKAWACEKSYKSRTQILEEYGMDPDPNPIGPNFREDDEEKEFAVYDWLDEEDNQIIIENLEELKASTPHGMGAVPVVITLADMRPAFQAGQHEGYESHYGGGLFKSDRSVFQEQNFALSILKELSHRSIKQGLLLMSRDGSMTLPLGDPRASGQETSLSTANEEAILPMPPMEAAREMAPYLQSITGMMQRGTFPASAFGELAFQLSGFAITQLRQGLQAPLTPHIKAVAGAYKQVLNILADAYATGQFDPMTLSGRRQDPQRSYFSEQIAPEMVREGGSIDVEIVAQLPSDDQSKVSLAQMLREGPTPMADDRFIREEVLEYQDAQQMATAVQEQLARTGGPMSLAWENYVAMVKQGDQDQAAIHWQNFQIAALTQFLQTMQLAMATGQMPVPQPNGGGSAPPPAASGPPSSVSPPQARGINAAPNDQAGANVPLGTPRPGAQETPFGR